MDIIKVSDIRKHKRRLSPFRKWLSIFRFTKQLLNLGKHYFVYNRCHLYWASVRLRRHFSDMAKKITCIPSTLPASGICTDTILKLAKNA